MDYPDTQPIKRGMPVGWIIAVLLVVVAWAGAFALRGGGSKEVMPGWADGMPAGQRLAKDKDKPMVVLFTASWCPPCREMKNTVLTKSEVHDKLMADFVPVQIDLTDNSRDNPNLGVAQRYEVEFLPTIIVMTPDGKPIESSGPTTATAFMAWLDRLAQ